MWNVDNWVDVDKLITNMTDDESLTAETELECEVYGTEPLLNKELAHI